MRVLGDEYVKGEFRAHREVENPMHIVSLCCFLLRFWGKGGGGAGTGWGGWRKIGDGRGRDGGKWRNGRIANS